MRGRQDFRFLWLSLRPHLEYHITPRLPHRLPIEQRDLSVFGRKDLINWSRKSNGSCSKLLGLPQLSEEVCLTNTAAPKILFVGDSHASSLYSSIFGGINNIPSLLISSDSCAPYPNLTYTPTYKHDWGNNCTEISKEVIREAGRIRSINTIVLVNDKYVTPVDDEKSKYWLNGVNLSDKSAFKNGYDYLVNALLKLKKRVIFVTDVPHLKYNDRRCFQSLSYNKLDCRYTSNEHKIANQSYRRKVDLLKMRFPEITIYDPTKLFCDDLYCGVIKDNKSLYIDSHHVSAYGSSIIIKDMQKNNIILNFE